MSRFYKFKKLKFGVCLLMLSLPMITGCQFNSNNGNNQTQNSTSISYTPTMQDSIANIQVDENGTYTSKEEVAAYIHKYKKLPSNYITEQDAKKLGWQSKKGNLDKVAPGKSIGGAFFKNKEKLLEAKEGRKYYTCDINYGGEFRGLERIVYSDDGMIYYTADGYKSFELLYETK